MMSGTTTTTAAIEVMIEGRREASLGLSMHQYLCHAPDSPEEFALVLQIENQ
ncbi:hypothetical protein [Acidiferrobacter sp.]